MNVALINLKVGYLLFSKIEKSSHFVFVICYLLEKLTRMKAQALQYIYYLGTSVQHLHGTYLLTYLDFLNFQKLIYFYSFVG